MGYNQLERELSVEEALAHLKEDKIAGVKYRFKTAEAIDIAIAIMEEYLERNK